MNVTLLLTIEKVLFILFRSKEDILHIFEQAYLSLRERYVSIISNNICTGGWELRAPYTLILIFIE